MFTGLVQGMGMVRGAEWREGDLRLDVEAAVLATPPALGDSISVNGACLTVVAIEGVRLGFDLSRETIDRTTLGALRERDLVNLEPALRVAADARVWRVLLPARCRPGNDHAHGQRHTAEDSARGPTR